MNFPLSNKKAPKGAFLLFCFFEVVAEHTDNDREDTQHLTDDGTDGTADDVVDQPGGGADHAVGADGLGAVQTEADGGGGHADDRQQLNDGTERAKFLFEHGEGQNVGGHKQHFKEEKPQNMIGMKLVFEAIDDGTYDGDDIEQAAADSAQHKEADGEEQTAKKLTNNDLVGGFQLKGKNIKCHGNDAQSLTDIVSGHTKTLFPLYLNG